MKKVTVLGAGLVGLPMAVDLATDCDVTIVDVDEQVLAGIGEKDKIRTRRADLADPSSINQVVAGADLVIGAVPGFMGYGVLAAVIAAGKNIVDISFFEEDAFRLDALAKEKGVTALVDCGVAPGMGNIILGHHDAAMQVERYACYVGGLPQVRAQPFEYKAPFSPIDVIAEYTREARFVVDGQLVTRPALSDIERLHFNGIGSLEAFNTDGLRSLLKTMKIPNMVEKTMRYPGHAEKMRMLREIGLFGEQPIDLKEVSVRPLELTAALLFPKWKFEDGEADMTVFRLVIEGVKAGKPKTYLYEMMDRYDTKTKTLSMARTTGYTCTAVARAVLDGSFTRVGICPPEYVGRVPGCLERIRADLSARGIEYRLTVGNG